jgi:hypothetical protein
MTINDVRGTADIFEEIPAILIVIVASFVFLISVAESFISYSARKEADQMGDKLDSFCDSVLSFEPLLVDSVPGIFDSFRLDDTGREKISEFFHPEMLGFHYNLTLVDVSMYEERYSWFAGEERIENARERTTSIPVIIRNPYGQHHSALLKVTIWELWI